MFKGTVRFAAKINQRVTFDRFEFASKQSNIEKIELCGPDGETIQGTVHFSEVISTDDGLKYTREIGDDILDTLSCVEGFPVEPIEITAKQFIDLNPPPPPPLQQPNILVAGTAHFSVTCSGTLIAQYSTCRLKKALEKPIHQKYRLTFRYALQTTNVIDRFTALYWILSSIFKNQTKVEEYILSLNPSEKLFKSAHGQYETIFTTLRNDNQHDRGIEPTQVSVEMAKYLPDLVEITKQAINK